MWTCLLSTSTFFVRDVSDKKCAGAEGEELVKLPYVSAFGNCFAIAVDCRLRLKRIHRVPGYPVLRSTRTTR